MVTLKEVEKRVLSLEKRVKTIQKQLSPTPIPKTSTNKKRNNEQNIGINVLAYLGMLALIFSLGFLFLYSFDKNIFSWEWINVIFLLIIGHIMFYYGFKYWKGKYEKITKLLLIAGGTINFFTIYTSYVNESIREVLGLSMELSVFLSTIIILELAWASAHLDNKVLLFQFFLFGIISSFLTEIGEFFGYFYAFIIILLALFITHQKKWNNINIPLIIITYFYYINVTVSRFFNEVKSGEAFLFIFLIAYYMMFNIAKEISKDKTHEVAEYFTNNISFFFGALWLIPLGGFTNSGLSFFEGAILIGAIANFFDGIVHPRMKSQANWLGIIFFSLLMLSLFDKYFDTLILAIIAIVLLVGGFVKAKKSYRIQGLILINFSFLKLLFYDSAGIDNGVRMIMFLIFAVIMIFGSVIYVKREIK